MAPNGGYSLTQRHAWSLLCIGNERAGVGTLEKSVAYGSSSETGRTGRQAYSVPANRLSGGSSRIISRGMSTEYPVNIGGRMKGPATGQRSRD